jgi:hypothetical protein
MENVMRQFVAAAALVSLAAISSTPAAAVNRIVNGSFEAAGTTGVGAFTGWSKLNTPDLSPKEDQPASVIVYNSTANYPVSAYTESVTPDNAVSQSPDAVGNYAAYFVGDYSVNETIYQDVYLGPGNFRVGFSYYLTQNGLNNINNGSLSVTILGLPVATTIINSNSIGKTWFYATGVAGISTGGWYRTALVFNSNGFPSKDVVVDRVFGVRTTDPATTMIGPGVVGVPEPSAWAMLIAGFGMVGFGMRRRRTAVAA